MVPAQRRKPALPTDCSADLKANGGKGSIAEQIAASRIDIVLGGGQRYFAQPAEGETTKTVRDLAVENGFRVIGTAGELAALTRGGKVLGLFAPGTMPVQWRGAGEAQARARAARRERPSSVLPEPFACEPNPEFGAMPTLAAMARAALDASRRRALVRADDRVVVDRQAVARCAGRAARSASSSSSTTP